jgi:hypothetical protein
MIPPGFSYQISSSQFQRRVKKLLNAQSVSRAREVAKESSRDIAREINRQAKLIVSREVYQETGRLAAGLGYYDPAFLTGRPTSREDVSTPDDAIFEESTRGGVYFYVIGTNVEYAAPILYGFAVTERRVVFATRLNRFITVEPFNFAGVHALERASERVDVRKQDAIFRKRLRKFEREWNTT